MNADSSSAPEVRDVIRPTTILEAPRLSRRLGAEVVLVTETFQVTGSFKFRAAYHLARQVPQELIITASSGNFGQGLARACQLLGKRCIVVMPDTSARVKIDAVREWGGEVVLIDVRAITRREKVEELARAYPEARLASAYDDPLVIEGNATLGEELGRLTRAADAILAPVGGGGLTAGILTGLRRVGSRVPLIAVEPAMANDAARSWRAGRLMVNEFEPLTMADGVRTLSLGRHNWAILKAGLAGVIEVSEEHIAEATRLMFNLANLKAEPTGSLGVAALLECPDRFRGQRLACVISGGNVDPSLFANILKNS